MTLVTLFILILYMIFLLVIYPKWYNSRHKVHDASESKRKTSKSSTQLNETVNENAAKRHSMISQMSVKQYRWRQHIEEQRERGLTAG